MPGGEPKVEKDSARFSTTDSTSALSGSCLDVKDQIKAKQRLLMFIQGSKRYFVGENWRDFSAHSPVFPGRGCVCLDGEG